MQTQNYPIVQILGAVIAQFNRMRGVAADITKTLVRFPHIFLLL